MAYTVYRLEKNGSETVIGCADDPIQAAILIDEDRRKIDWEASYRWHYEGKNSFEEWDGDAEELTR